MCQGNWRDIQTKALNTALTASHHCDFDWVVQKLAPDAMGRRKKDASSTTASSEVRDRLAFITSLGGASASC